MDESRIVHLAQAVEHGQEDIQQLFLFQCAPLFQDGVQAFPLLVAHDHIRGIVELEHRVNPYDIGMVELRQSARFADEPFQSPPEIVGLGAATGRHGRVVYAGGKPEGQVLLDRDRLVQIGVMREIGNAETALPENAIDPVPVKRVILR